MSGSLTLTAEEFKQIHNGLCDLRFAVENLEGVLSPLLYDRLVKAKDEIHKGLQGAFDQEDREFNRKSDHYMSVADDLNLNAIWSMYEVQNLNDRHSFEGVTRVVYRNHNGVGPVSCTINGGTWAALYVAANACIRDSGDCHHVFIEDFTKEDDTLILFTGS